MPQLFNTIGILGRVKTAGVKDTLEALVNFLLSLKKNIVIEHETAEFLSNNNLKTITREEIGKNCDLLIVVGGDGSLLNAAHAVVDDETPVLGINRGKLGFLTDILPTQLDKIKEILEGKYTLEKRFLLTSTIKVDDKIIGSDDALNEVAIIPDAVPHMIEFEIYIDGTFVCSQDSDGLIVATPTGSTAYALSGGGPILHPQLDAIVLVPMFPHSLNNRPIVVEGNREITVVLASNGPKSPRMSCDGRAYIASPAGSRIVIRKKAKPLLLVHPLDYSYYEALRSKLHWGKKLSNVE